MIHLHVIPAKAGTQTAENRVAQRSLFDEVLGPGLRRDDEKDYVMEMM